MLTEQEKLKFIPPVEDKRETLSQVITRCQEIKDILSDKVFGYTPLCLEDEEQREAEHIFFNSIAMWEIVDVDGILSNAQELADKALQMIDSTSLMKVS